MTIGQYLKKKRNESGISQMAVSLELGFMTAQYISNVERGLCSPTLHSLSEWCDFIGASKVRAKEIMVREFKEKIDQHL